MKIYKFNMGGNEENMKKVIKERENIQINKNMIIMIGVQILSMILYLFGSMFMQ